MNLCLFSPMRCRHCAKPFNISSLHPPAMLWVKCYHYCSHFRDRKLSLHDAKPTGLLHEGLKPLQLVPGL